MKPARRGHDMLSYWLWLAIFVFAPILLMLWFHGKLLFRYRRTMLLCGLGSLVVSVPWDFFSIKDSLWWFPSKGIMGVWFFGLPLEEWIFISFIGMELSMLALLFVGGKDA